MPVSDRKREYRRRLEGYLRDYPAVLVINVDNVGSLQLQQVRAALRGKAEVLMGKNTLIRMVIREMADSHPKVEALLPLVRKNIGLVFTKGDLSGVRDILVANRVPASAKVGIIAPCDVFVPAGPTGLDPGQTGFFQALNISTKIVRGAVEIINDVHLIKEGDKVTPSAVSLLSKLDLRPFSYGIVVQWVYENGSVYSAKALDIKASEIQGKFLRAVNKLTAVSLVIGTPNYATLPHSLANAFKKVLAIALAVDEVSFPQAEKFKLFVKDPAAYVAKYGPVGGAAPAAAPAAGAAKPAAAAAAPAKKESSSSSSMGGGGGLFGDDSD